MEPKSKIWLFGARAPIDQVNSGARTKPKMSYSKNYNFKPKLWENGKTVPKFWEIEKRPKNPFRHFGERKTHSDTSRYLEK